MANPHDLLFKRTFSDPAHAEGELRMLLPPALVAQMDFAELKLETGSFVDQALTERHSDLLYSVPLGEQRALVYLLFEHQSRADPLMSYRLLRYMVRIWEQHLKAHPRTEGLPLLIPIVLYHGAQPWCASRDLADLIQVQPELKEAAAPFIPRFDWLLDDLSTFSSDQLRERALTALARLVLYLLKSARTDEHFVENMISWAQTWRDVVYAPGGLATVETLIRYIAQVGHSTAVQQMEELLAPLVGKEFEEVVMTAEQFLMEKGFEKGEAQRIARERQVLLRLIEQRFGRQPVRVVARVEVADGDMIEHWLGNILAAESVEALLTAPPDDALS